MSSDQALWCLNHLWLLFYNNLLMVLRLDRLLLHHLLLLSAQIHLAYILKIVGKISLVSTKGRFLGHKNRLKSRIGFIFFELLLISREKRPSPPDRGIENFVL